VKEPLATAKVKYGQAPAGKEMAVRTGKDRRPVIPATVECKTRFVQADLPANMDVRTVRKTDEKRFKRPEPAPGKSATFDQRKENGAHKRLAENTVTVVYFCHSCSPREEGTGKNANYPMRRATSKT
jgi:IS30 family transposase